MSTKKVAITLAGGVVAGVGAFFLIRRGGAIPMGLGVFFAFAAIGCVAQAVSWIRHGE